MIGFLLEQQARFSSDIEELKAEDKRLSARISQVTSLVERVVELQRQTQVQLERTDGQIEKLQVQLERTDGHIEKLVEAGKEANERINILFQVVDGIIHRIPPEQPPPA